MIPGALRSSSESVALKNPSRLQIVVTDSVRDAKCQVQMALLYLLAHISLASRAANLHAQIS